MIWSLSSIRTTNSVTSSQISQEQPLWRAWMRWSNKPERPLASSRPFRSRRRTKSRARCTPVKRARSLGKWVLAEMRTLSFRIRIESTPMTRRPARWHHALIPISAPPRKSWRLMRSLRISIWTSGYLKMCRLNESRRRTRMLWTRRLESFWIIENKMKVLQYGWK